MLVVVVGHSETIEEGRSRCELLRAESKDASGKEEGMETVKRACVQGSALEVI